eukprot:m.38586 g.38586  ORF g.38586 m.38586 type:complete len:310 (-) comp17956_c0_seq1:112-1041(-)
MSEAALLKRFEAVIKRLEAVTLVIEKKRGIAPPTTKPSPNRKSTMIKGQYKRVNVPGAGVRSFGEVHETAHLSSSQSVGETEERTPELVAFDELSNGRISDYFTLSAQLGPPVSEQAELVRQAYVAQRRLIKIAPHTQQPGPKILSQLLEAIELAIRSVLSFETADEKWQLALGGVGEGSKALAWVSLGLIWRSEDKQAPFEFIKSRITQANFDWFEGIIEGAKSDPSFKRQVELSTAFVDAMTELLGYVEKFHKKELSWGSKTNKSRSMTFWSNALAQTAPGEGLADEYEYSTKLGIPIQKRADSTTI